MIKPTESRIENARKMYFTVLIVFILLLSIIVIVLSSLDIESQLLKNISIGVISSLISSAIFYLLFSAIVDEKQKEYSAESAANIATQYAIDRIELAPLYVYPSSYTSNDQFDEQFKKNFTNSNFYYFKGASAGFATYRLTCSNTVRESRALETKSVRFLLLDPQNNDLLEEFARSNLRLNSNAEDTITLDSIKQESNRIKRDIYTTILGIYNISYLCDIDMCFHDEFVFFRSEIFSQGLFISYYNGNKTFPGSAYYEKNSDLYQAYLRNFIYYFNKGRQKFSLNELSINKNITIILKEINCPYSHENLQTNINKNFKNYEQIANK